MTSYLNAGPWAEVTFLEAPEIPTVVNVAHDYPMAEMASLFDTTFSALFPAMGSHGLHPAGAPFSLHHRMPTDTCDLEVGIPVDRALDGPVTTPAGITLTPSVLPAGRIAVVSYLGAYDGLGPAWGDFMGAVVAAGEQPDLPFWEIYVTEPTPDTDPATLRTDLVTRLRD